MGKHIKLTKHICFQRTQIKIKIVKEQDKKRAVTERKEDQGNEFYMEYIWSHRTVAPKMESQWLRFVAGRRMNT